MLKSLGNRDKKKSPMVLLEILAQVSHFRAAPCHICMFSGKYAHFCTVRMGLFCTVYSMDKPSGQGRPNFSLSDFTWLA